jgi:hypothetical protein
VAVGVFSVLLLDRLLDPSDAELTLQRQTA